MAVYKNGVRVSILTPTVPGGSLFLVTVVMETFAMVPEQTVAVDGFILRVCTTEHYLSLFVGLKDTLLAISAQYSMPNPYIR